MLDPFDGVFGRFDLAALCGCHTLNVCCCCCQLKLQRVLAAAVGVFDDKQQRRHLLPGQRINCLESDHWKCGIPYSIKLSEPVIDYCSPGLVGGKASSIGLCIFCTASTLQVPLQAALNTQHSTLDTLDTRLWGLQERTLLMAVT